MATRAHLSASSFAAMGRGWILLARGFASPIPSPYRPRLTPFPHSNEPATNVTRIARAIEQTCLDGTHQIISYYAGVGTGHTFADKATGGAFGMGLDSVMPPTTATTMSSAVS